MWQSEQEACLAAAQTAIAEKLRWDHELLTEEPLPKWMAELANRLENVVRSKRQEQ